MVRERVDRRLVDLGLAESRERAQALVMAGRVFLGDRRVEKPGTPVDVSAVLSVRGDACPYVSRGGLKLAAVLEPLSIDPAGAVCADVGSSTGGFTDVLLSRGAVRVHAVDVGRGQLHVRLRSDPRVVLHEGVNARHGLRALLGEAVGLVTMDLSFISLTLVLPAVVEALTRPGVVLAMVKPQFELSPREVGPGGVVRDDALRMKAVEKVETCAVNLGLVPSGRCEAGVAGPSGNREVFVKLVRTAEGNTP